MRFLKLMLLIILFIGVLKALNTVDNKQALKETNATKDILFFKLHCNM